jgi:alpha-tubulin suppressor-like RCC1 family protein
MFVADLLSIWYIPFYHSLVSLIINSFSSKALSSDGKIYSWGIGECGELGRYAPPLKKESVNGEEPQYDLPNIFNHHIKPGPMYYDHPSPNFITDSTVNHDKNLKMVQNVKVIGCGAYHSMMVVVGSGDQVFSCGLNNYGQLGLGDLKNRFYFNEIESLTNRRIISMHGKSAI